MRDLDDFRSALARETAGLRVDVPTGEIRRRARRVRARRAAVGAAVAAAVLAVVIPVAVLALGPGRGKGHDTADPGPGCDPTALSRWLGRPAETGVTIEGGRSVIVGLVGTVDAPVLVAQAQEPATNAVTPLSRLPVVRTPEGALTPAGGVGNRKIVSMRLLFEPATILDVGIYVSAGHRITVTSRGRELDAREAPNEPTGWTVFWSGRTASPALADDPVRRAGGKDEVTLKAYINGTVAAKATAPENPGHAPTPGSSSCPA